MRKALFYFLCAFIDRLTGLPFECLGFMFEPFRASFILGRGRYRNFVTKARKELNEMQND